MQVKIKICGITQFEDARAAITMGADAIGFVFDPKNPRYIPPHMAKKIIVKLPPFVTKVGVFVNESPQKIIDIFLSSGIDTVQFNGDETAESVGHLTMPVIKKFSVDQQFDLSLLDAFPVSAFLLDTWNNERTSGTFNWKIARNAVRLKKNIILAGRLGATNIKEALTEVEPYGVDICESVEVMPGKKNPQKMGAVIKIVKEFKKC